MHKIFKRYSVLVSKKTIFNNIKKWQWETATANHPFLRYHGSSVYLQCNSTIALRALLAHIQVCMPGWIAIASLIGATCVCHRAHSYAIAISWSTACMVKSGPQIANIGVFKTIYGPVRLSSTCISEYRQQQQTIMWTATHRPLN